MNVIQNNYYFEEKGGLTLKDLLMDKFLGTLLWGCAIIIVLLVGYKLLPKELVEILINKLK